MGQITTAVAERNNTPAVVTPKQALTDLLNKNKGAVGASLPSGYSADRFVRLLLTAANTNPELLACEPRSFLAAGVAAAQLGLEPNDARGLAYLVPFKDRKRGKIVQLIIGYKGKVDLARRSGMVSAISAQAVYAQDVFEYSLGLDPTLHHVPGDHDENPADITHFYAVAKVQGEPQFVVMTRRQVDKIKASSQAAKSEYSPWSTHYAEMGCKTAFNRLAKWLPQTVEMIKADVVDGRELTLNDLGEIGHSVDPDVDDFIDTTTGEITRGEAIDTTAGGEPP